ncbi:MAG: preprotein translocase subunit SecA, partial [Muribaculaceae bacterium]|nr:preprotein translocase subunit SecA [Muribaculaceae bacterium]
MSLTGILKTIFGDKSTRDMKAIRPILNQVNALRPDMAKLTNDQLRENIDKVRADLAAATGPDQEAIDRLKAEVETLPFDKRQPVWDEIDAHEKKIIDTLEDKLNEHLPIVFATVRETAARFAGSETVVVKATQMDRDLAATGHDFVTLAGDHAIW